MPVARSSDLRPRGYGAPATEALLMEPPYLGDMGGHVVGNLRLDPDGPTLVERLRAQLDARDVAWAPVDDSGPDDRYLATMADWPWDRPVLLISGAVWLTNAALDTMVDDTEPLTWFGRSGPSAVHHGEDPALFGVRVTPDAHGVLAEAILSVRQKHRTGHIERNTGWEVYRATQGYPLAYSTGENPTGGAWVEIDDWSEEFLTAGRFGNWANDRRAA